jgi:hypothetical protein
LNHESAMIKHMSPLVLLIAMAAVPVLVLMILRVNAAIVFLSLCLGSVLVRFVGSDTHDFVNLLSASQAVSGYGVMLALLLLPPAFTTVVMIGTIRGKFRLVLNLLPALSVGLLAVLLAEPLFSAGLRGAIESTTVWPDVVRANVLVVGVGSLVSLLFLWLQRPKRSGEEKHRRR